MGEDYRGTKRGDRQVSPEFRSVLLSQIRTVVERVGVTDTTVEIIADLTENAVRAEQREQERVKKRRQRVIPPRPPPRQGTLAHLSRDIPTSPGTVISDPIRSDLLRSGSGDLSGVLEAKSGEIENTMSGRPLTAFELAMQQFGAIWERRYGVPYEPTPADRNQLGRLLRGLKREALARLPDAFEAYLQDVSPFVCQEQRHNLRWFVTSGGFNKYRVVAPVLSSKEARAVAAGDQWLEMHSNGKHQP